MASARDMTLKLAARVIAGERSALARAITLTESRRADHAAEAAELLQVPPSLLHVCTRARGISIRCLPAPATTLVFRNACA